MTGNFQGQIGTVCPRRFMPSGFAGDGRRSVHRVQLPRPRLSRRKLHTGGCRVQVAHCGTTARWAPALHVVSVALLHVARCLLLPAQSRDESYVRATACCLPHRLSHVACCSWSMWRSATTALPTSSPTSNSPSRWARASACVVQAGPTVAHAHGSAVQQRVRPVCGGLSSRQPLPRRAERHRQVDAAERDQGADAAALRHGHDQPEAAARLVRAGAGVPHGKGIYPVRDGIPHGLVVTSTRQR
jgi:hypothetical protein